MDNYLSLIKEKLYDKCGLTISKYTIEDESKEYAACRFELNDLKIVSRNAKITPKKVGQFVTFWKRNLNGIIEPLKESDLFDFYVITATAGNRLGQFVFPNSVLVKKGILSTDEKEGKRGFRVYPSWDKAQNNQAKRTQKWQLNYFIEINEKVDTEKVLSLYGLG